ncbi:hypothetical protein [Achromobacter spanius]|uniref:Restriction endonuclease n=1 Tax=Achromobacter spanius TaxID=217203 RepID=A0A2S0I5P2_9BURK|nr:hypothetical protein [Achromobacter spanius]AVJ27351.1 hypothetical protein CLM73_09650 [Achromobacter spanius]
MSKLEINGDFIVRQLPGIISWLVSLGLPAANSRYARYDKIIKNFFRNRPDTLHDGGNQLFRDLSLAYRESVDIYIVYRCFKDVRHPMFIEKLSHVVAGQDVPEPGEAGASRNYLFELLIAARFQLAGYDIDFEEKTDVVARRNGHTVRIECKRLSSENKLNARINEAANQLSQAVKKVDERVVGLIYIDVSSFIVEKVKWEVNTRDEALHEVKRALKLFLGDYGRTVEAANKKHLGVSFATCFTAVVPIWTRSDLTMQTVLHTDVLAASDLPDEKFQLLNEVVFGTDHGFKHLFETVE